MDKPHTWLVYIVQQPQQKLFTDFRAQTENKHYFATLFKKFNEFFDNQIV